MASGYQFVMKPIIVLLNFFKWALNSSIGSLIIPYRGKSFGCPRAEESISSRLAVSYALVHLRSTRAGRGEELSYPQARFARLGLRASLSRCSRPLRGRRKVRVMALSPGSLRSAYCYLHLCRDAHDLRGRRCLLELNER